MPRAKRPLAERFWEKVLVRGEDECWPWLKSQSSGGYGTFSLGHNESVNAHVVAYFLGNEEWPQQTVDHTCFNRLCQNPKHLEDVPMSVNIRRQRDKGCKNRPSWVELNPGAAR